MQSFEELSAAFAARFNTRHFPLYPGSLYDPAEYFLGLGGKRIQIGRASCRERVYLEV